MYMFGYPELFKPVWLKIPELQVQDFTLKITTEK